MKTIKTYATQLEANIARIALEAAGIPSIVIGVGAVMEGGIAGVRLQVPEEMIGQAMEILEES